MSHRLRLIMAAVLFFVFPPSAYPAGRPTVILMSFDGFRWDYLNPKSAPTMAALAAEGVRAPSLIPVYPSSTYTNHYSMVTGLYAEHHGIVGNIMWDPILQKKFNFDDPHTTLDSAWWGGEPIWVTAEKAGIRTAGLYWMGTTSSIQGIRPMYSASYPPPSTGKKVVDRMLASITLPEFITRDLRKSFTPSYKGDLTEANRFDQVLSWLDLPADERPQFIALYLPLVDGIGHRFGPDSVEEMEAITLEDKLLGEFINSLKQRGLYEKTDIVVVSDHGMEPFDSSRLVPIDSRLPAGSRVSGPGTHVGVFPPVGMEDEVYAKLQSLPHTRVYRKADLPERFHFRDNVRIAPIVCLPEEGWMIDTGDNAYRGIKGIHGYDNTLLRMQGIFFARGPSFRAKTTVEPFESLHIHSLLLNLLALNKPPSVDTGDDSALLQRIVK